MRLGRLTTLTLGRLTLRIEDFLIDVPAFYVREFDADSFRFDAPMWNFLPNWTLGLPCRASASLYGVHELLRRAREALKPLEPDLLFYTEPSGPLARRVVDLAYNYD